MKNRKATLFIVPILLISTMSIIILREPDVPRIEKLEWMNFTWVDGTMAGQYFERLAINVPVRIEGIPHDFTFQFDLGANLSLVYDDSIEPYLELYASPRQKLATTSELSYLRPINLTIDNSVFEDESLSLRDDDRNPLTIDSVRSNTVKHIGTIGVDLFQDQVLIIDYPNTRLAVTAEVPQDMKNKAILVDITLDRHGRVHLPMRIDGERQNVFFDTGSSLFPFSTTPKNWAAATSGQVVDSVYTSTWGKRYYTYGATIDDIYIGDEKLPEALCYKNEYLADFMREEGIWGVTGNAYFWDGTVIIDFANKKFGWIK